MNRRKKKRRKEEEVVVIAPYTNIRVIYYKRRAQDVGSEPPLRVRTYVVTKTLLLCFTVSVFRLGTHALHVTMKCSTQLSQVDSVVQDFILCLSEAHFRAHPYSALASPPYSLRVCLYFVCFFCFLCLSSRSSLLCHSSFTG